MKITNLKLFHAAVFAFALSASSCQMLQGVMGMLGPLLGGVAGGLVDEGDHGSAMSLTGGAGTRNGYQVVSALGQEDDGNLYGMYSVTK
jgi:hypothetical protein